MQTDGRANEDRTGQATKYTREEDQQQHQQLVVSQKPERTEI